MLTTAITTNYEPTRDKMPREEIFSKDAKASYLAPGTWLGTVMATRVMQKQVIRVFDV